MLVRRGRVTASCGSVRAAPAVVLSVCGLLLLSLGALPPGARAWPSDYESMDVVVASGGPIPPHRPHSRGRATSATISVATVHDRVGDWGARYVLHGFATAASNMRVLPTATGCNRSLATPDESAAAAGGCQVAVNGGFFDPRPNATGELCLGAAISDGAWVTPPLAPTTRLATVAFTDRDDAGRRYDGARRRLLVGYLNATTIALLRPAQLISGAGWIVRAGRPHVQQSMALEDWGVQTTGSAERFRSIRAPRTAMGHDDQGRVMLVAVDGDEGMWEGLNLDDLAEVMLSMGAVNAINLDGGGNVSVYVNRTLVNVPSDECDDTEQRIAWGVGAARVRPRMRCPRPVGTVVCLGPSMAALGTAATATESRSATPSRSPRGDSVTAAAGPTVSRTLPAPAPDHRARRMLVLPTGAAAALWAVVCLAASAVAVNWAVMDRPYRRRLLVDAALHGVDHSGGRTEMR